MKLMTRLRTSSILFISIIILSVVIRFIGINPGYPPYHSDDGISYSAASSMIVNGNLVLSNSNIESLGNLKEVKENL